MLHKEKRKQISSFDPCDYEQTMSKNHLLRRMAEAH